MITRTKCSNDLKRLISNCEAGYSNDMGEFQEVVLQTLLFILERG